MYLGSKKTSLFFFLLFLIQLSTTVNAQENGFITGKIIDSIDKTAIPFTTIQIKNKAKGLISNMDGGFKIPHELHNLKVVLR